MEKWDGHRAITDEIHYEYLFKSLILLIIIYFICLKNENKLFSSVFCSMIISSIIVYLSFKIFRLSDYRVLAPIPGRLMITFTFIAWPIALSLIYYRFKEIKYINYFLLYNNYLLSDAL